MNTYAATGFNRADRMEIKSALSLLMGDLKADMRLVSKVACGGDILVRNGAGSEAKFDYNSGKFAYKPVAQGAENVIDQVNEVYFNYVQVRMWLFLIIDGDDDLVVLKTHTHTHTSTARPNLPCWTGSWPRRTHSSSSGRATLARC